MYRENERYQNNGVHHTASKEMNTKSDKTEVPTRRLALESWNSYGKIRNTDVSYGKLRDPLRQNPNASRRVTAGSEIPGNLDRTVMRHLGLGHRHTGISAHVTHDDTRVTQRDTEASYSAIFTIYSCLQNVLLLTSGPFPAGISGIHRTMRSKKKVGIRLEWQLGTKKTYSKRKYTVEGKMPSCMHLYRCA